MGLGWDFTGNGTGMIFRTGIRVGFYREWDRNDFPDRKKFLGNCFRSRKYCVFLSRYLVSIFLQGGV